MEPRVIARILRENPPVPFREAAATKQDLTCAEVEAEFSKIELTEREKALGLLHAYTKAIERMEQEQKQRLKQHLDDTAKAPWTYTEQKMNAMEIGRQIGMERNFEFIVDEENEHIFHLLCLYFTNNPEFEEYGFDDVPYSLKKGIWLQSATRGTGKSILLQLFARNKRNGFVYQHVPELRMYMLRDAKAAMQELEMRTRLQAIPVQRISFFQENKGFMYDEIFGEEKVNLMGNPFDISEFIIQRLYDQRKEADWFWKFHITSNYDGDAIEAKCGPTVRSRMAEMFNLIKLEGRDRRKRKK